MADALDRLAERLSDALGRHVSRDEAKGIADAELSYKWSEPAFAINTKSILDAETARPSIGGRYGIEGWNETRGILQGTDAIIDYLVDTNQMPGNIPPESVRGVKDSIERTLESMESLSMAPTELAPMQLASLQPATPRDVPTDVWNRDIDLIREIERERALLDQNRLPDEDYLGPLYPEYEVPWRSMNMMPWNPMLDKLGRPTPYPNMSDPLDIQEYINEWERLEKEIEEEHELDRDKMQPGVELEDGAQYAEIAPNVIPGSASSASGGGRRDIVRPNPVDVILAESVAGDNEDAFHVGSAILNRSTALNVPVEQILMPEEFSSIGKPFPPGVTQQDRTRVEQIWYDVQRYGPTHKGLYFATPSAMKNLPSKLEEVARSKGHVFFSDPLSRSIRTAEGVKAPTGPIREMDWSLWNRDKWAQIEEDEAARAGFSALPREGPAPEYRPEDMPRGRGLADLVERTPQMEAPSLAGYMSGQAQLARQAQNPLQPYANLGSTSRGLRALDFDSEFASRLESFLSDPRVAETTIFSGNRTIDQQRALYDRAIAKYGSATIPGHQVARPGRSRHNYGLAADLRKPGHMSWKEFHNIAKEYGLHFPVNREPWHAQLAPNWQPPAPAFQELPQRDVAVPSPRPADPTLSPFGTMEMTQSLPTIGEATATADVGPQVNATGTMEMSQAVPAFGTAAGTANVIGARGTGTAALSPQAQAIANALANVQPERSQYQRGPFSFEIPAGPPSPPEPQEDIGPYAVNPSLPRDIDGNLQSRSQYDARHPGIAVPSPRPDYFGLPSVPMAPYDLVGPPAFPHTPTPQFGPPLGTPGNMRGGTGYGITGTPAQPTTPEFDFTPYEGIHGNFDPATGLPSPQLGATGSITGAMSPGINSSFTGGMQPSIPGPSQIDPFSNFDQAGQWQGRPGRPSLDALNTLDGWMPTPAPTIAPAPATIAPPNTPANMGSKGWGITGRPAVTPSPVAMAPMTPFSRSPRAAEDFSMRSLAGVLANPPVDFPMSPVPAPAIAPPAPPAPTIQAPAPPPQNTPQTPAPKVGAKVGEEYAATPKVGDIITGNERFAPGTVINTKGLPNGLYEVTSVGNPKPGFSPFPSVFSPIGRMLTGNVFAPGPRGGLLGGLLGGMRGLAGNIMPEVSRPTLDGRGMSLADAMRSARETGQAMGIGIDNGVYGWGPTGEALTPGALGAGWISNNPESVWGGYGTGYDPTPV